MFEEEKKLSTKSNQIETNKSQIDPPTEHETKKSKGKGHKKNKPHGSTEFIPKRTNTEERKRPASAEERERPVSTEVRERPASAEERERPASAEGRERYGSTESKQKHENIESKQEVNETRKSRRKQRLESIEAARERKHAEANELIGSKESSKFGTKELKVPTDTLESEEKSSKKHKSRKQKKSRRKSSKERRESEEPGKRRRSKRKSSSKEPRENAEPEKHRKSKGSSSSKPDNAEPGKRKHSKKRHSISDGVAEQEKRRHSRRKSSSTSERGRRHSATSKTSSVKSGAVRRSESEELRELLKSDDDDDRGSGIWSGHNSGDSDDDEDYEWDPDQLYRPLYNPIQKKRLIYGKFDVSEIYGDILLRGELIETSTDSTQTKETAAKAQKGCYNKCLNTIKRGWQSWHEISSNEEEDARTGYWDYWTPYYCLLQGYNPSRVCRNYITWLILIFISHNRQTDLIYATYRNGGFAYIVALGLVYIGVGFPMAVIETLLGQYSGRRTFRLFRFLSPALSGIAWALYIRTFMLATFSILFVVYTSSMIFDFFFCSLNTCRLLKDFSKAERHPYTFTQLGKYVPWDEINVWHENVFFIYFLGYTIYNFNNYYIVPFSHGLRLGLRLLFTFSFGTLFLLYHRIVHDVQNYQNTLMFAPLELVLTPKWERLYHARTWLDAFAYVSQTCALGTMVHPYLGSKLSFHYRPYRDIFFTMIFGITWSFLSSLSLLLWMGYVIVTKAEMVEALNQLGGWYGLYITILRKSNQASLCGTIDPESNFFIGFHYSLHALIGIVSSYVMIHVLIHNSYTDHCIPVLKKLFLYLYLIIFIIFIPLVFLLAQGLRHLMFLDFFLFTSYWPTMIVVGIVWVCMAYSHSLVKFVFDVRNMLHLRAYGPFAFEPLLTHLVRASVGMGLVWSLIWTPLTQRLFPITKEMEFAGIPQYIGLFVSLYPFVFMACTSYYHLRKMPLDQVRSIRPHWNWYKNYGHSIYCFYNRKKDVVLDILSRCKKAGIRVKVPPIHLLESTHVQNKMLKKPTVKPKRQGPQPPPPPPHQRKRHFRLFPDAPGTVMNPY